MTGARIAVQVLAVQQIANVSEDLAARLSLPKDRRSLGILTTDCDDVTYIALDEATKAADVTVAYGRSFYAGAANASTRLAGEVIGILAGKNPDEVQSGLQAAQRILQTVGFRAANEEQDIVYLAHCVSRTGSYLSRLAHIRQGQALAYLIAPPAEAVMGLDAALKAAEVTLTEFFEPPSETNFAGGLLTGSQSACQAACDAFAAAVMAVAQSPKGGSNGTG